MKYTILTIFYIIAFNLSAQTISVSDFGVQLNSFLDATEGVKKAIESCKNHSGATLVFPKGRYDFYPENAEKREYFISNTSSESECPSKIKNVGLLFENMKNLTVEGNGSLFVFHGKMITYALVGCENIQLQNFTVDFDRPTMSEITFTQVTPTTIEATVHPDSKYAIMDGKVQWFGDNWVSKHFFSILTDSVEGTELYSSWDPLLNSKVTELDLFKLRFEGDFTHTNYKVGKTLTIRDHIRDHVGVFINLSKNVRLNNITMHYMHGLGIVSQFSENLHYNNVQIIPSRKRMIASSADGMHFSGCKGFIKVENCRFKGLHDDPMNIHGTYLQITEIQSPTELVVRFMHSQTYGFPAFFQNDTIAFIRSEALLTYGKAVATKVSRVSDREIRVELSKPIPKDVKIGDCLENLTWTPSLTVRNCRFEMTNTRGLLVTTPREVLIENNYFYRIGMHAIQIAGDAGSWYESGAVQNVTIRKNVFDECGYNIRPESYPIAINPENHEVVKDHWVHHNIYIRENTFNLLDGLILKARSTNNLVFQNNTITQSNWVSPLDGRKPEETLPPAFKLENCNKVVSDSALINSCLLDFITH